MTQTDREMIEAWLTANGQSVDEWRKDELGERDEAVLAGRWRVVEDVSEDEGPFEDEQGIVLVSCVGDTEYGNLRVHVGFKADGMDSALEVDLGYLEQA